MTVEHSPSRPPPPGASGGAAASTGTGTAASSSGTSGGVASSAATMLNTLTAEVQALAGPPAGPPVGPPAGPPAGGNPSSTGARSKDGPAAPGTSSSTGARSKDGPAAPGTSSASGLSPPPGASGAGDTSFGGAYQQHTDGSVPYSPQWFAGLIGAAVAAAATASAAAAGSASASTSSRTSPSTAPRRLADWKLPDFWESDPTAWFRLFDAHLLHFNPSEDAAFDTLLPLLTPAACKHIQPIVRAPGPSPYSKAKTSLLRHFERTPRDLAREFRNLTSLGDMLPSDMLEHLYGLLPDPKVMYEVVFLDLLPPSAKDAALQHSSLADMAAAADKIVREGHTAARISAVESSPSLLGCDAPAALPVSTVAAVRSTPKPPSLPTFLCDVHLRWGKLAFKCSDPANCHMKNLVRPKPGRRPPPPGNSKAGRQ